MPIHPWTLQHPTARGDLPDEIAWPPAATSGCWASAPGVLYAMTADGPRVVDFREYRAVCYAAGPTEGAFERVASLPLMSVLPALTRLPPLWPPVRPGDKPPPKLVFAADAQAYWRARRKVALTGRFAQRWDLPTRDAWWGRDLLAANLGAYVPANWTPGCRRAGLRRGPNSRCGRWRWRPTRGLQLTCSRPTRS
jgi:hypothetical protein